MKLIIAGSRDLWFSPAIVDGALISLIPGYGDGIKVTEVVSGGATGADSAGEYWARIQRYPEIPIRHFLPDWDLYGRRAGPIRNSKMAAYADALLLIWDGKSKGSADIKKKMEELEKPVYEVILRGPKLKAKNT